MLSAEKLAYIRSIKGLSQQEIAARIGCTKSYISMLENRKQEFTKEFYEKWLGAIYGSYDFRVSEEYKKMQEEKTSKEENKEMGNKRSKIK